MGKITKEELSSSLNDHIDSQGNDKQNEIDSNLQTSDKTIVGAINELYQNINDGKALIANAIGEPLTDEDSFTTMSNGINSLTSLLKTNLTNAGVDVNDEDKLKSLISKVKGIVKEDTSKGIKFAEGTGSWNVSSSVTISSSNLNFIPDIIICHFESLTQTSYYYGNYTAETITSYKAYITNTSPLINTYNSASKLYISDIELGSFKLKMDSVNQNSNYGNYWYISGKCIGWYAIGLDEKDATLRDALASILRDEGVTVTEEDNMASLITKVDQEFDRQVVPQGTARPEHVLQGVSFMNSSGTVQWGSATVSSLGGRQFTSGSTSATGGARTVTFSVGFTPSLLVAVHVDASGFPLYSVYSTLFTSFTCRMNGTCENKGYTSVVNGTDITLALQWSSYYANESYDISWWAID